MASAKHALVLSTLVVSACASGEGQPQFRSFDLELVHTSPYSTYIGVAAGSQGAKLPRLRQLDSREFSKFLRDKIGCVYDHAREIHALGSDRVPAGYMVPIVCL